LVISFSDLVRKSFAQSRTSFVLIFSINTFL
jgi:hypothetical protein